MNCFCSYRCFLCIPYLHVGPPGPFASIYHEKQECLIIYNTYELPEKTRLLLTFPLNCQADLRLADFRAKQRAMEDALMALEVIFYAIHVFTVILLF